jgi:isoamylase
MLGKFATRLTGSGDLYDRDGQTPRKSINFITCHDGFTLYDLVSYSHKNNLRPTASRQPRRRNHNHSHNSRHRRPHLDPAVAPCAKQQKNLLATLFLSQGVPMMLGGDEFGRTQLGNNNAYCQDNEHLLGGLVPAEGPHGPAGVRQRRLIQFRKAHPVPCAAATSSPEKLRPRDTTSHGTAAIGRARTGTTRPVFIACLLRASPGG